jgi:hypothetical protein
MARYQPWNLAIELSSLHGSDKEPLRPDWNTPVNLSGPGYDVLAHEWRVDRVLTIS